MFKGSLCSIFQFFISSIGLRVQLVPCFIGSNGSIGLKWSNWRRVQGIERFPMVNQQNQGLNEFYCLQSQVSWLARLNLSLAQLSPSLFQYLLSGSINAKDFPHNLSLASPLSWLASWQLPQLLQLLAIPAGTRAHCWATLQTNVICYNNILKLKQSYLCIHIPS